MSEAATAPRVSQEDRQRADLYNYLGLMLARPPEAGVLAMTAGLSGDDTALGRAVSGLAQSAASTAPEAARAEFDRLFVGIGRGELVPYASFYLTGFLNEKPLAKLRSDLASLGIARAEGASEPEDGAASLMETMGALIVGRFGAPTPLHRQRDFFATHVGPWAGHFFADLEGAKGASLYAALGAVGRRFMEIERDAFRMTVS